MLIAEIIVKSANLSGSGGFYKGSSGLVITFTHSNLQLQTCDYISYNSFYLLLIFGLIVCIQLLIDYSSMFALCHVLLLYLQMI